MKRLLAYVLSVPLAGLLAAAAPGRVRTGMRAWLDAPAREAAVVYINGQRAGASRITDH